MKASENHLHQLMDSLRSRLLTMGFSAQQAVDKSIRALLEKDIALADEVIAGDNTLDAMEVELDASILNILARSQPVACDLRLLTTGIRLVVDLERIGDEAVNVARRAMLMADFPLSPGSTLANLCEKSNLLLRDSLKAFQDGDVNLALQVRGMQDEAAQLVVHSFQTTLDALQEGSMDPWYAMHLLLCARSLERVCGRAANIAEHAYFLVEGVSIKHTKVE